ncbi:MAG: hypothetical protein K1X28_01315 [Parachlamydiales bacterium]|nr:hypothetical protein [Parachlamydiales bacterium]
MDLNPVDWNQAQNLLIKLVQALSPLAVRPVAPSIFLSRRFFVPPPSYPTADFFQRHPVKLLHEVQKEVEKLIAEPSKTEETPHRVAVVEKAVQAEPKSKPEKTPAKESSPVKEKALVQQPSAPSVEKPVPLVRQAKELIHQVQEAIGKLANSTYMQEPTEAPLREVLKKLKPSLDRILDAVVLPQEKPDPVHPFRHALPIPVRQEIIKKLHTFKEEKPVPPARGIPKAVENSDSSKPIIRQNSEPGHPKTKTPVEKASVSLPQIEEIERQLMKPAKKTKAEKVPEKVVERRNDQPVNKKEELPQSQSAMPLERKEQIVKQEPKPLHLPIAPLLFEPKRTDAARKKKKRKGFWFKEEERDPSDR